MTQALIKAGFEAAATVNDVAKILRTELDEIEDATSTRMRAWTQRAAVFVEVFHLTQEQAAEKLRRSQSWVSSVLRWRREGYKNSAFGPQAKQARLLVATNKVPPAPTGEGDAVIRTAAGDPVDTSAFSPPAKAQIEALAGDDVDDGVETMKQAHAASDDPDTEPVENSFDTTRPENYTTAFGIRVEQAMVFARDGEFLTVGMVKHSKNPDATRVEVVTHCHAVVKAWAELARKRAAECCIDPQDAMIALERAANTASSTLSPEEISDDALSNFKKAVAFYCPNMTRADLGKARVWLSDESKWRPRKRKAA